MQNHAERFADRLVLPTLGLAVSTALLTRDFNRFLSLVIIDYGTAIRVAAPTAVLASMTNAARNGVLIKSGSHMEKLANVDTIVFDKTGTLSHGIPHVVEVLSYKELIKPDHLLALAVAAETHLHHPVAEALREKSRKWTCSRRHVMNPCTGPGSESMGASTATTCMLATNAFFARATSRSSTLARTALPSMSAAAPAFISPSMASLPASSPMRTVSGRKAGRLLKRSTAWVSATPSC